MANLKTCLTELGQGLFLPEEAEKWARQQIEYQIFEKLKEFSSKKHSINRTRILGSSGKRTGIWVKMDYDCVVFVNEPPPKNPSDLKFEWDQILDEWEKALSNIRCKKRTHRGFDIKLHGLEIDLLIAFDATQESSSTDPNGQVNVQFENTLEVVNQLPPRFDKVKFAHNLSTSLSEQAVYFMKSKNAVTHELARVAKLWMKFAYPPEEYVSGKSTIIELIVVEAVKQSDDPNDILKCFREFLTLLKMYGQIKMTSKKSANRGRPPEHEPAIMDPSNPYNNLYDGKNVAHFLQIYSERADETLRTVDGACRLQKHRNRRTCIHLLYVKGSAERHGIPGKVGWPILYISLSQRKVHNVQKIKADERLDEKALNDLNFVCFNAAFVPVPQNKKLFRKYRKCLQRYLRWTAKIELVPDYDRKFTNSNFEFEYPVSWANGIRISARITQIATSHS